MLMQDELLSLVVNSVLLSLEYEGEFESSLDEKNDAFLKLLGLCNGEILSTDKLFPSREAKNIYIESTFTT